MINYILNFLFFFIICCSSSAQYIVIDRYTKQPIPYVNIIIEGDDKVLKSGEDGKFYLPKVDRSKFVTFSAEGYKTTKIQLARLPLKLSISPENNNNLTIVKEKQEKVIVGKLPSGSVKDYPSWYGNSGLSNTIARYIPNEKQLLNVSKISSLKIITASYLNNSTFNVSFYEVNEKKEPGKKLHTSKIIGIASKGIGVTDIDVSNLDLEMPGNGIFIALEWLIIDSNKYVSKSRIVGQNGREVTSYEPGFGMIYLDFEGESFSDFFGRWKKEEKLRGGRNQGKVTTFAVEMTLTD